MANSVIYRDLSLRLGHGLPLWRPEPDANLPEAYTKQGISIGDLGLLTDDGGFDYLFNIHANAHDPVNSFLGTPASFRPLPLDRLRDVRKNIHFHQEEVPLACNADYSKEGTLKVGAEVAPDAGASLKVEFTITQKSAAMLVLPHGADRYQAKPYDKYKTYISEHGKSWYEYLNSDQQRGARNGSLYLVTGCDKARSWGLAAGLVHRERQLGFSIMSPAGLPASGTVGFHASWSTVGGVESRRYPALTTEITEDENQCVFARGFVIGINENFIKKRVTGIVHTAQIDCSPRSFPAIGNNVPYQTHPGQSASSPNAPPTSQRSANESSHGDLLGQEQDMTNFDDSHNPSSVVVQDYPENPKPVLSPGSYICDRLLSSRPDIDVVVVHDNDWIEATSSDADDIFTSDGTDYERLTTRVLEIFQLQVAQGVAMLISSKQPDNEHSYLEQLRGLDLDEGNFPSVEGLVYHENRKPKLDEEGPRKKEEYPKLKVVEEAREQARRDEAAHDELRKSEAAGEVSASIEHLGEIGDMMESIRFHRGALELKPPPHPDRSGPLNNLANALYRQFQQKGNFKNLEESIQCHREALELRPAPHPNRSGSLNNLANVLSTRFKQKGDFEDLEESIQCHREALELRPARHPDRSGSLNNLANALYQQFQQKGGFEDLEESTRYHREALELRSAPHPDRSGSLNNLANVLSTRFEQRGDFEDLEESIRCHREALELRPAPHSDRSGSLNNLANVLSIRFEFKGDFEDLEESIRCHREASELRPAPHSDRSGSLNNLANVLSIRFEFPGEFEDLEEFIQCHRKGLELRPALHPDQSGSLNNLANVLSTRFKQKGDFEDLEESIRCHREALELRPAPHPERLASLNNLANVLSTRFTQRGDCEDLEESIRCHREVLELRPASHPDRSISLNKLASALYCQFEHQGEFNDLQEAITCYQEALQILPTYHPQHLGSRHLGIALMKLHSITSQPCHLEAAMDAFRVAVNTQSSSSLDRFLAGKTWASSAHSSHPSALEAYQYTMALLPHLATLGLDLQARQEASRHSDGLARNAASCAISARNLTQAIEFLEERGVFWSQALRLRTPFDRLQSKVPVLATKLRNLSNQLEQGSFRNVSRAIDDDQKQRMAMAKEANHFHHLDEDWNRTLKEVRSLDEFRDFLLPKPFHELKRAAINRRIVMLNASEHGCDGLILSEDGVTHIPFPTITTEVAIALGRLLQLALSPHGTRSHIPDEIHTTLRPLFDELHSRGRLDLQRHRIPNTGPEILQCILGMLWLTIVHPVVCTLGLQRSDLPPRLWWYPTGPFVSLPFHAAGIYDSTGTSLEDASDYMISSYTLTLNPLLTPLPKLDDTFKMLVVVEPSSLPYTLEELTRIKKWVLPEHLGVLGPLESPTIEDVLSQISRAPIAHFACPTTRNYEKPLESGLRVLPGDHVTISSIMKIPRLNNALLAFLSASQTAAGDEKVPDEAIHIAAAMLFAGFRGVVGTMWTIQDEDAPDIVDNFYRHLFKDGLTQHPDTTEAARALHLAVKTMRKEKKCSFERWVPFIHLGL